MRGLLLIHQRLLLTLLELLLGLFVLLFGFLLRLDVVLYCLVSLLLDHQLLLVPLVLFQLFFRLLFFLLRPVVIRIVAVIVGLAGVIFTVRQDDELTARRRSRKLLRQMLLHSDTHDDRERGDDGRERQQCRARDSCPSGAL